MPKLSLVIDTETTGVNPALDRIVEIAIILTDWQQVYAVLSTYVNPGFSFRNPVNGLSDRDVAHAPTFRTLCSDGFIYLLRAADDFVAHQAAFDLRFLSVELRHLGLSMPTRPVFDTFKRRRFSLADACAREKIATEDISWHSALGDCVATFRLARKLRELNEEEEGENQSFGMRPMW